MQLLGYLYFLLNFTTFELIPDCNAQTVDYLRNGNFTSTDFKQSVPENENDIQMEINNLKNVTAHLLQRIQVLEDQNELKHECSKDTCFNGGECIDEVDGYTCVCPLPWVGHTCQHKLDPCKANQCKNDATCFPSSNYLQYVCSCASGYNGTFCEFDFGQCLRNSSLCLNGGTCHSTNGSYTCDCALGFDGVNCAQDIDDCAGSDLCQNGGTCIDGINNYSCICAAGFEGENCRTPEPDAYSKCSMLARSNRTAMTVVNADCGGVVPMPNFPSIPSPSSFLFEYNPPNMTQDDQERCIWTLDQTKDGILISIRVKVTLLCGDLVDSEGGLSVLNMDGSQFTLASKQLKQKDEYYESKSRSSDWKIFLSYDPSKRHESRFLALITVLGTGKQAFASSSFVFDQLSGIQSYGPFGKTDVFSLVVVNPSQINTTFTVDVFQNANPTSNPCFFGNGDVFDIYEIPTESPPNRLDRFCSSLSSARSYSSQHSIVILTIPHTQKASTRFQISWK